MSDIKEHIIEPLISNPKVQATIASGTVGVSMGAKTIDELQNIFGLIGTVLGCIATAIIIYKNIKELNKDSKSN